MHLPVLICCRQFKKHVALSGLLSALLWGGGGYFRAPLERAPMVDDYSENGQSVFTLLFPLLHGKSIMCHGSGVFEREEEEEGLSHIAHGHFL